MPLLTNIINAEIREAKDEFDAKTLTRPVLKLSDGIKKTYVVDLDVGEKEPLRNVPIAMVNREIMYAEVGSAVRVRKSETGKYEVVGFSKRMPGVYREVAVTIPKFKFGPQTVYQGPTPIAQTGGVVIGTPAIVGYTTRLLTFDELLIYGVYGLIPYGAFAEFRNGNFVRILV